MSEKKTEPAKQQEKAATGLRWIGARKASGAPQRFIDGVPARDLTAEETAALSKDTHAAVLASGLYTTKGAKE